MQGSFLTRLNQLANLAGQLALIFISSIFFKALLQPADTVWIKLVKGDYANDYNFWFVNGTKIVTKWGNLAGPGYELMCNWIHNAWRKLDPKLIFQSFKGCGITSNKLDDYNKHLKAVVQGVLPANASIIERKSKFDFEDACLFADLDESESDDSDNDYD